MGFKRELVLNGMRNYGNDKQKVLYYIKKKKKKKKKKNYSLNINY